MHACLHTYIPTYLPTCLPTYLPTYIHTYLHTHTIYIYISLKIRWIFPYEAIYAVGKEHFMVANPQIGASAMWWNGICGDLVGLYGEGKVVVISLLVAKTIVEHHIFVPNFGGFNTMRGRDEWGGCVYLCRIPLKSTQIITRNPQPVWQLEISMFKHTAIPTHGLFPAIFFFLESRSQDCLAKSQDKWHVYLSWTYCKPRSRFPLPEQGRQEVRRDLSALVPENGGFPWISPIFMAIQKGDMRSFNTLGRLIFRPVQIRQRCQ